MFKFGSKRRTIPNRSPSLIVKVKYGDGTVKTIGDFDETQLREAQERAVYMMKTNRKVSRAKVSRGSVVLCEFERGMFGKPIRCGADNNFLGKLLRS
jgi:hypothetical protein